jgi:hypothetical protein
MNYDCMCELTAAVLNKAINDGSITESQYKSRIKHGEETGEVPYKEYIFEVRSFVEDFFSDHPQMMKKVYEYWANPTCRQCRKRIDWPRDLCKECREKIEKRREDLTLRPRRRQRSMDL